ncbi:amidohydrolase family protein [Pseudonocardia acidicola]|uniref:Amidohydrolase n=1 Tax=Pseudonocardia acidicola TaxID=2724939 RepID=A0ABX1S476_9PSEU|nr:amidohydrolase family protein [Pseudonocardia acidicola]NMH96368.1 amidohydrolase [Pseudonocardia acidicola]
MVAAIDVDVHHAVPGISALFPHLPDRWIDYCVEGRIEGFAPAFYPPGMPLSARPGARPAAGPPGSDVDLLRDRVLDGPGAAVAVLNCLYAVGALHNTDWAGALASAVNDWQAATWLDADPRLRAAIVVVPDDPAGAAAEIERCAADPRFVQVLLPAQTTTPLGRRVHRPIYAAAERAGLPVAIHPGVAGANALSPVGWPSHYIEDYANAALAIQSQLTSLVAEGVFTEHPGLRVVLLESGVTWLPPLMWRFDKNWKALRREVPWVDRPPSQVIREHVRFAIAPFDGPVDPPRDWIDRFLTQVGSVELLLYASDHPHWHDRDPHEALLDHLSPAERERVLRANAAELYRLDVPEVTR